MKLGMGWALVSTLALAGCGAGTPSTSQTDASAPTAAAEAVRGVGVVEAVDAPAGTVKIAHQPIVALGWPAMTMSFKVANTDLLKRVSVGEKVEFELGGREMSSPITSIEPAR